MSNNEIAVNLSDASQEGDINSQAAGIQQAQKIDGATALDVPSNQAVNYDSNTVADDAYYAEFSLDLSLNTARSIQGHLDDLIGDSSNTISGKFLFNVFHYKQQSENIFNICILEAVPIPDRRIQNLSEEIIFAAPLTFNNESGINKLKLLLSWLLPKSECDEVKNGKIIQNISAFLKEMRFNGYLRFFSLDYEILKPCMSSTSWKLFLNFKKQRENDAWICPICELFFDENAVRWRCERCIFYFHDNCCKSQGKNDLLCFKCFFQCN